MPPRTNNTPESVAAATAWIDAYIAGLPAGQRAALQSLREAIAAAAPAAVEGISYGVPAFRYRGRPLVAYAAATNHLSLFPMGGEALDPYRADLAGYGLAKGTVRFTPERPLPPAVVAGIVRARVARLDAG